MDINVYPFKDPDSFGSQSELNSLADKLEEAYQSCQITADSSIDLYYTGQVHKWYKHETDTYPQRNPEASEIYAETFIALAHGAKGITYYKYLSKFDYTNGDSIWGLVAPDYTHSDEIYAYKWQAVHDIFAQLDSIGGILQDLERDTAFCVFNDGQEACKDPIDSVYFAEDDGDYIEVGHGLPHPGQPPYR